MAIVVVLATIGSVAYIHAEQSRHALSPARVRAYFILLGLFASSMIGSVETANLGLLFVLVEGCTLTSVVLVAVEGRISGLRAGWNYLIISSLGITIALVGTLFLFYAATGLSGSSEQHLSWPYLVQHARGLNRTSLRLGFLLAVIGYGTKVGLVPMHTWLPDAHAEAPSPASAMLSGALLNVGMYAIHLLRRSVAYRAMGAAYAGQTLLVFLILIGGCRGSVHGSAPRLPTFLRLIFAGTHGDHCDLFGSSQECSGFTELCCIP